MNQTMTIYECRLIILVYRYWIKAHSFGETLTYFVMRFHSSEAADLERSGSILVD